MDNRNELLANMCAEHSGKETGDKKRERKIAMECNVDDNNNLIDARISSLFNWNFMFSRILSFSSLNVQFFLALRGIFYLLFIICVNNRHCDRDSENTVGQGADFVIIVYCYWKKYINLCIVCVIWTWVTC